MACVTAAAHMPAKQTKTAAAAGRRVQPFQSMLHAYCKQGSPIYVPKGSSEKAVLKLKSIADSRTASNSELCRRVAYRVSMAAGSVEPAADYLHKHAGAEKSSGSRRSWTSSRMPRARRLSPPAGCSREGGHVSPRGIQLRAALTGQHDSFGDCRSHRSSSDVAKAMDRTGASTDLKKWLKDPEDTEKYRKTRTLNILTSS